MRERVKANSNKKQLMITLIQHVYHCLTVQQVAAKLRESLIDMFSKFDLIVSL